MFADDEEDEVSFTINERFAHRYDNKKRHEELTNLKAKYGDDYEEEDEDDTDEEEDEFGELVTPEVDAQIMKTIATIRAGKAEVYDSSKEFFSEKDIQAAREKWEEKKRAAKTADKPMRLKDFHREQLLGGIATEDDDARDSPTSPTKLSFAQEQALLKNEFKKAVVDISTEEEDVHDNDLLVKRDRTADELQDDEEDYRRFLLENMATDTGKGLKEYRDFKQTESTDPQEAFLMNYILSRGWMDKEATRTPTYDEIVGEDDISDVEAVEAAEEFERKHNFRFEEEGSTQIVTHAREIDGTLRRKDDKRKRQRESKASRQSEEALKKAEELKRLKNLKKEEIMKRLEKIKEIAGTDIPGLEESDLLNDFDANEFDQKMAQAFDEQYYDKEEENLKPDFGDDIDISDIAPDLKSSADYYGADAEGNENLLMDADYLPGGEYYEGEDAATGVEEDTKSGKANGANGEKEQSLEEYLEEYYQLDYEDMIGDMPTRFKYRKVDSESYGLKPDEILEAEDADLNELIGLKKLAPFRRQDLVEKEKAKFNKSKKKRLKEFRKKLVQKRLAKSGDQSAQVPSGNGQNGKRRRDDSSTYDAAPSKKERRGDIAPDRLASYTMPKRK
ncbi:KRI1-like family C-terminal-domain-containing protein [Phlyctochytrium arcticum]|nr:KRI1-like family C-terminal-domain-containing protein [Phlyctochytrium arcticum]